MIYSCSKCDFGERQGVGY